MARRYPPVEMEYRRRRAADMRRLRSRRRRRVRLLTIEIGDRDLALAIKFAGLRADQVDDTETVSTAISRLLGKGLAALLNEKGGRAK